MEDVAAYVGCLLGAYIIGGIPFGLIIGKINGVDIRNQGSGNIGATNVGRCCGKGWGILCFLLDFCKGAGPVYLSLYLAGKYGLRTDMFGILGAVGAVCGHIFCPYLKFKGGKGIATSAGALFMLAPSAVGIAFAVWALTLVFWRYVGLSSVCAAAVLPVGAYAVRHLKESAEPKNAVIVLLACIGLLAIYRHKGNLVRLTQGTEPKIGQKKKEA